MKWVYNTPTPPFKSDFMMICQKYRCIWMHIGVYRAQQQGYDQPLQLFMFRKAEERVKTTWRKSSIKNIQGTKFETCLQLCLYIHLIDLNELLLVKEFDE